MFCCREQTLLTHKCLYSVNYFLLQETRIRYATGAGNKIGIIKKDPRLSRATDAGEIKTGRQLADGSSHSTSTQKRKTSRTRPVLCRVRSKRSIATHRKIWKLTPLAACVHRTPRHTRSVFDARGGVWEGGVINTVRAHTRPHVARLVRRRVIVKRKRVDASATYGLRPKVEELRTLTRARATRRVRSHRRGKNVHATTRRKVDEAARSRDEEVESHRRWKDVHATTRRKVDEAVSSREG